MQDGFRYINCRKFIQLAVAAAASPGLLQKPSNPISVLRSLGYSVKPYPMSADEYDRTYGVPVGICGLPSWAPANLCWKAWNAETSLRMLLGERSEPDLTGENGIILGWKVVKDQPDGFVCV
jgi:hypothetical protein